MPTLLVAYDLDTNETATPDLTATIRRLAHRWARPLASLWYIETHAPPEMIEAALAPLLGDADGLIVQEITGTAAVANTMLRWTVGGSADPQPSMAAKRNWPPHLVTGNHRLPNPQTEVATAA
jgi:hypothetical protein